MDFIIIIFIILIFLFFNSYILYPFFIWLIAELKKSEKTTQPFYPSISVIISAYNEEKVIEKRIRNILEQKYDSSKIEILVGSDNSTDNTNEILKNLEKDIPNLRVFIFNYRQGKAGVINQIVKQARNDILIFTDANTEFKKDAIINMVRHFQDQKIGGVCGKLILIDKDSHRQAGVEEKNYWEIETLIKKAEGKLGILIGANGGIFSIRKELFEDIPIEKPVTDDFFISLTVVKKGFKLIYEPEAQAVEEVASDIKTEFRRKIRFAATNFQTITFLKPLLFNRNILLSYAFWSHKIIRWFLPLIMILIFILNLFLIDLNIYYLYLLYIQIIFYLLGFLGYLLIKINFRIPLISLITYFLITNLALLLGLIRFLRKKHSVIWQSTPR